eukprot:486153_1
MGNKLTKDGKRQSQSKPILSMKKFLNSKNRFFRDKQTPQHNDSFILQYNRSNQNIITDIDTFDQRRLLFVSLFGLFRNWKKYPSIQLYSAIIVVPLKEEWIYNLSKYAAEMKKTQLYNMYNFTKDVKALNEFIHLLQWKNAQGLVFWILNDYSEYSNKCTDNLVDPFWIYFNSRLTNLYDPVTQKKYAPVKFDVEWWRAVYKNGNKSNFDVKVSSILHELYCVTQSMKYKSIQEIVYQSNPKSLIPIASGEEIHQTKHMIKMRSLSLLKFDDETNEECDIDRNVKGKETIDVGGDQGNWVIADDYC